MVQNAEKYIYLKYIFHYNCNLVINFTNLLCGSINRRICGLDFSYTSCDECVAKVIFTCRCGGGRGVGAKGRSYQNDEARVSHTAVVEMANPDPFTDSGSSESVIEEIRIIRVI